MQAAVVNAPGQPPVLGEFPNPTPEPGQELITVTCSAVSQLAKARASGTHYSSDDIFPAVVGVDGVGRTQDGRRVYFVLPDAPYGALAEQCPIDPSRCVEIPDTLDDITAAALANPGMSAWAALVERAALKPGETVLVNGATSTAGRLAVQLAKYLGAAKVIVTGRNQAELEQLRSIGADIVIPFTLGPGHSSGAAHYEQALIDTFAGGIDVVVDYLWGESAKTILTAIVKAIDDATPVRFVHVGAASGEPEISLPGAVLRSSAVQLMGSGLKSVSMPKLLGAIRSSFQAAGPARLQIATLTMLLAQIEQAWQAPAKPRIVLTIP